MNKKSPKETVVATAKKFISRITDRDVKYYFVIGLSKGNRLRKWEVIQGSNIPADYLLGRLDVAKHEVITRDINIEYGDEK